MKIKDLTKKELEEILTELVDLNDYKIIHTINNYLIERFNKKYDELEKERDKYWLNDMDKYWEVAGEIRDLISPTGADYNMRLEKE